MRFSQEVFGERPQGPAPESLNLRAPPYFGSNQGMRRLPVGKKAPSALDLLPKAIEGTIHDRTLSEGNLSNATTASTINGDRGFRPSLVRSRGGHLALPDRSCALSLSTELVTIFQPLVSAFVFFSHLDT